jgi:uncharacterized membrane protein YdjX (TVP38/TMEM64 family)
MNFKKLRRYSLIILLAIYVSAIIFESFFSFNQTVIIKLVDAYENFSQPSYVLILTASIVTGIFPSIVILAGFFMFTTPTLLILSSIGIILGIPLIFILSRKIGQKAFYDYTNLNEIKAKKLKKIFKNNYTAMVVLFNFSVLLPSIFGCIIGGLGKAKMTKLIFISILGNLINQIAYILFMFGIQYNNLFYIIPSLSIMILTTGISFFIYRKNIKDVLKIIFKR